MPKKFKAVFAVLLDEQLLMAVKSNGFTIEFKKFLNITYIEIIYRELSGILWPLLVLIYNCKDFLAAIKRTINIGDTRNMRYGKI